MRVLAVDTTTPRGSVAIVSDRQVEAEARVVTGDGHSRWLLPAADALLRGLGVEPSSVDVFAVTTGPGSFTGLRIGISSVQGLALASGRPCLGLSALDVMAWSAAASGPLVALMNAFRGEHYSAVYDAAGARVDGPAVGPLEQALALAPEDAAFVGDLDEELRGRICALRPRASFPPLELFLAAALGRSALLRANGARAASELRPLYLRGVDVRVPRA